MTTQFDFPIACVDVFGKTTSSSGPLIDDVA